MNEPIGYIDRKDIERLSNYKATIWPGVSEIDAVPVYLADQVIDEWTLNRIQGQARAWHRVADTLDQEYKTWLAPHLTGALTGAECAELAIRSLAQRANVAERALQFLAEQPKPQFEGLSTSDLILCVNLLQADARSWEEMNDQPQHQHILNERAADRRALAFRMHAEVQRRDVEQLREQS